jgi:energy-coupling factor transporter ATP-binding protein EcfA2
VTTAEFLLGIVAGLIVNECCDLSPWIARKLVRWSARLRYTDATRAQLRADELAALIDDRPGKLFKLFTALGFTTTALAVRTCHATSRRLSRLGAALQRLGQRLTSRYSPTALAPSSAIVGEDLLERADFARGIAATVRSLDASKGTVVAVRGPWGSGKSSMINLLVQELRASPGPLVIEFNPWVFWNDHQPTTLFEGLASQLRLKSAGLTKVADSIRLYGDSLAGTTTPAPAQTGLGAPRDTIGRLFNHRSPGTSPTSQRVLKRALRKLPQPLVVVIDDIDRLPPEGARSVFRFVHLTAHLPQLIYVTAFDRTLAEPLLAHKEVAAASREVQEIAYDLSQTVRRPPPNGSWVSG